MKKSSLLLVLLWMTVQVSFAQVNWKSYSQSFSDDTVIGGSKISMTALIPMEDDEFWTMSEPSLMRTYLQADTVFIHSRPGHFVAITTFDTTKAQFFLNGVTPENEAAYQFRVLDGLDKVIIPWSPIRKFAGPDLKGYPMSGAAYIGGYKAGFGHKIIVDVRRKDNSTIITSAVVEWVPIKPMLVDVYTPNEFNVFMARLNHAWTVKKSVTDLSKKLVLASSENNLVFYLKGDIYEKKLIEYELIKDDEVYTNWKQNDFDNSFIWLKNLTPGKYELKMRFSVQRNNVTVYHFEIKKAWYQSNAFRIIAGILTTAFFGAIFFIVLFVKQRQKAEEELSKKKKLQLELQTIHSQLNPHFVFNALGSIQGLINKNDIAGANSYLSDFAQLLRNSLSNGNRKQTPLSEEIKTLETYLKLEQLRFQFEYKINVSDRINIYETEIPSLLLQPLIENSIKHGISVLKEKGRITLDFNKNNQDMVVTLKDNGNGFELAGSINGFGLKLTRDRVKLLNQMLNRQQITFEINTAPRQPTIINLTFKNWFNEN
jgi:two-component system LytT family sensor kinase